MRDIFRFFAERNLLANLFTIAVLLIGLASLFTIKRDQYPEVEIGQIVITTFYPGASPEDVELNVTNKIEDELREVTGIRQISSVSMENVSSILIDLDFDLDNPDDVKDDIRRAVGRVTDLPEELKDQPHVLDVRTPFEPFIEVGVSGSADYKTIREFARILKKKLEAVPEIQRMDRIGYRAREVKVEADPKKLASYQIPMQEILMAVAARNIRGAGGSLESYTSEKSVVTLAQFRTPQEVGDVIVRGTFDGPLVRVRDLAIVEDGFIEERVQSRVNGKLAISLALYNKQSADVIRAVEKVKELVERERKLAPPGIEIQLANDTSRIVSNQFSIVLSNGLMGLVCVTGLLWLFLNLRTAIWVSLGIPVALLGTIAVLPLFGLYLDTIVLTSLVIVIGIVVDDAIIVSESIFTRLEQGMAPLDAAVDGIAVVYLPVLTTITTTMLAFVPMFFMPGMLGKFVVVIPLSICLALFISWLEVSIALPAHIVHAQTQPGHHAVTDHSEAWFHQLRAKFGAWLVKPLKWRYLTITVFIGVLGGSIFYAANFMDIILFPTRGSERFIIGVEAPIGSSLNATGDVVSKIEKVVETVPKEEIESFVTRVGLFTPLDAPPRQSERFGTLIVNLTPWSHRDRSADEIVEWLREKIKAADIDAVVNFGVISGGPPAGKPVTVRLTGGTDSERKALADETVSLLKARKGVKDIDRDDKPGKDEVRIMIDYPQLARHGLTVADVARTVRMAYDGEVATSVRYGDEDVDFRVSLDDSVRRRHESLPELLILNRHGRLVPLGEVAKFDIQPGPADIHHFDRERVITIRADVNLDVVTPLQVTDELITKLDVDKNHPGMRVAVGGEVQETQESMQGLYSAFILGLLGIYFLLILLFNSLIQPLIVMFSIPIGIAGVILAFALHGESFGFLAMLGAVGMAGVVVNDSLVLVDHLNNLRKTHPDTPLSELVAQGTADRLRSIFLTSATTVVGLLPLAYGIGGSDLYMGPMALALGWGILFATPLTLVLIPSLYMVYHDAGNLLRKLFPKWAGA